MDLMMRNSRILKRKMHYYLDIKRISYLLHIFNKRHFKQDLVHHLLSFHFLDILRFLYWKFNLFDVTLLKKL